MIPMACRTDGTPASPSIHLHLFPNARQISKAASCPIRIQTIFEATRAPLIDVGAISARYIGTTIAAVPTPSPTTNLPKISIGIDGENAMIRLPMVNKTSANKIVCFLPNLSEIGPPNNDPIAPPANVKDTTSSFCKLVTF